MYVGLCITAWAKVDEELFDIFVEVTGTTGELGSIIYYRITTLSGRLHLVDELTLSILPKPERKNGGHPHALVVEWTKLKNGVNALSKRELKIAHYPVDKRLSLVTRTAERRFLPGFLFQSMRQRGWTLSSIYVGQSERLRGKHDQTKPLTAESLPHIAHQVQAAALKLGNFRAARLRPHVPKRSSPA